MNHGAMSHEEMMRHCQMMEQEAAAQPPGSPAASGAMDHGAMSHDGMSHEEMMRQCETMRRQAAPADAQPAAPHQH